MPVTAYSTPHIIRLRYFQISIIFPTHLLHTLRDRGEAIRIAHGQVSEKGRGHTVIIDFKLNPKNQ